MKTIQVSACITVATASLLSIIALATDYWIGDGNIAVGLFKICQTDCDNYNEASTIAVTVVFITGTVEMLAASIILFMSWNRQKVVLQKIGTILVLLATIQYIVGCCVLTWHVSNAYTKMPEWGLSYIISWATAGLSLISSVYTIYLLPSFWNIATKQYLRRFKTKIPSGGKEKMKKETVSRKTSLPLAPVTEIERLDIV